jgi:hypothetical protein
VPASWVTAQSEYSTDVVFRTCADLEELMPRLLTYSTLYFEARDVLAFLGRKLSGNFLGDVVTDQVHFSQMPKRLPGRRVKHRMKRNWMKLYNTEGAVLRNRALRAADATHRIGMIAPIARVRVLTAKAKRGIVCAPTFERRQFHEWCAILRGAGDASNAALRQLSGRPRRLPGRRHRHPRRRRREL